MAGVSLRSVGLPFVVAFALATAGCQSDPYAEVIRAQQSAMEDTLAVLTTVKDEASMKAARVELKKVNLRFQEIARKRQALLHDTEKWMEATKDMSGMQNALNGILGEVRRIRQLPQGDEFLTGLGEISNLGGVK